MQTPFPSDLSTHTASHNDTDVVIYHGGGCLDGFASAFIAWKALDGYATYVPLVHHRALPEDLDVRGKRVVAIDIAPKWATMLTLRDQADEVLVLDHHQGALDDYRLVGDEAMGLACFDTSVSGCVLAWRHFFPDQDLPDLFAWIADKDLWADEFSESRRFCRRLEQEPLSFERWEWLFMDLSNDEDALAQFLQEGALLLNEDDRQVQSLIGKALPIVLNGHRGLVVNAPSSLFHAVCHVLAQRSGTFGFAYQMMVDNDGILRAGGVICSEHDVFDVLPIAKAYGGGGHPSSAGMGMSVEQLQAALNVAR